MAGKGEGVAPVMGGVMQNIGLGECRPEEKKRTQKNEHGDGKPPLHESTVGDGSLENAVVHGTPPWIEAGNRNRRRLAASRPPGAAADYGKRPRACQSPAGRRLPAGAWRG